MTHDKPEPPDMRRYPEAIPCKSCGCLTYTLSTKETKDGTPWGVATCNHCGAVYE